MKALVVIFALLFFGCISLAGAFTVTQLEAQAAIAAAGGDAAIDCVFQQTGCVLAVMAQTLEDHVWGADLNTYNPNDQVIRTAYQRWLADCGGHQCSDMAPGNLQCVKFVEGVFVMANDPLPFHHDAILFWSDYAHLKGWSEIGSTYAPAASRGWPAPGDMVIWANENAAGQPVLNDPVHFPGHIAVVVRVDKPDPKHGIEGRVVVAQGNGPGNTTDPKQGLPGNLYSMPLNLDKSVSTWGGFMVVGYIRQDAPPTGMPSLNMSDPNVKTYLPVLLNAAATWGIPGGYYAAQIKQESGFNPKAVSPAGAEGIAQFMPSTAAGWNPPFDPFDPMASLNAGAQYMINGLHQYAGDYAAALAAYNAGGGTLARCMKQMGVSWLNCMPAETQNYVNVILGW
jgi:hypothetical protein